VELEPEGAALALAGPAHHCARRVSEQHGAIAEAPHHRLLLVGGRLAAGTEEEVPGLPGMNPEGTSAPTSSTVRA